VAIEIVIPVIETGLWPQHDARDPLGVWGARNLVNADASGGTVTAQIAVLGARRRSRIYTCYNAMSVVTTETVQETSTGIRCRLLTNWPDVDPSSSSITGFATWSRAAVVDDGGALVPTHGPVTPLVFPQDRFILLFDPGVVRAGTDMVIVELSRNANVNTNVYSFEAYGYYWDRSVLNVPGGPRHPGSS